MVGCIFTWVCICVVWFTVGLVDVFQGYCFLPVLLVVEFIGCAVIWV